MCALPSLGDICEELVKVRTNWTKFGLQLGVSQCKLKEFEDERDPFAAVLDYWLAGNIKDAPKDWSTILKVLESNYVDESGLAGKIREKFSIQPENRASISSQSERAKEEDMAVRSLSPVFTDAATGSAMEIEGRSRSCIMIGKNVVSYSASTESTCTPDTVLHYVQNVKAVRAFGAMLDLDSGVLNKIEKDPRDSITLIVTEWFNKRVNMSDSDRWEELAAVLMAPIVFEPEIARSLPCRPPLRKGSSVDSAISMASKSPRSSISSPDLLQYQLPFVESIGNNEDCSIQNVLNIIALYSEWYEIGLYLQLPHQDLEFIQNSYKTSPEDYKVHLVELWKRIYGLTWERLRSALRELVHERHRKGSSSSQVASFSPLVLMPPPLPTMQESGPPVPHEHSVKAKVKELQSKFGHIQEAMMKVLTDKKIKFKEFRRAVCSFPGNKQLNAMKSLKMISDEMDVDYIFSILNCNFAWSFLDYYLLEGIVERFGSDREKQSMEEYSKEISIFRRRTTVYELIDAWDEPSLPEKYEECSKIIQNLEWDPKTHTLEQLDRLRKHTHRLLKEIPLSEVALVLINIKCGCVVLTWLVSSDLVPHFKSAFAQCIAEGVYFKENDIISLELDGDIFKSMESQLLHVCEEGKVRDVDSVLEKWNKDNHNCNEVNEDGKTAFIVASELGRASVVVSLLEADIDVDINYQTEDMKWSALFYAYKNGHWNTVRLLLEYGANPDLRDKDGKLPKDIATGKPPTEKRLFDRFLKGLEIRADKFRMAVPWKKKNLWHFCEAGDREAVERLLENEDMDINMQDHSHKNWAPLHYACRFGHYELAKFLLDRGAEVDLKAEDDWTPLPIACYYNFVRISNLLLKRGADPNLAVHAKHFAPIMLATSDHLHGLQDMEPLARSLLKHGAKLDIADHRGWTPVMNASNHNWTSLVQLYLDHKADPNQIADRGWTALMSAARVGAADIAKLLIEKGANMELKMDKPGKRDGYTALHVATYVGSVEVVRELVEHGADLNVTNAAGLTPLMIATNMKNTNLVKELLKSGTIDIDQPHKDAGLSAPFVAVLKGCVEILELFLQHGAKDEIKSIKLKDIASIFKRKEIVARLKKHQFAISQQQRETQPQATPTHPQERVPERVTVGAEPSPTTALTAVAEKPESKDSVTTAEQTDVEGTPVSATTGPPATEVKQEGTARTEGVESTQESQGEQEQDLSERQHKDESGEVVVEEQECEVVSEQTTKAELPEQLITEEMISQISQQAKLFEEISRKDEANITAWFRAIRSHGRHGG